MDLFPLATLPYPNWDEIAFSLGPFALRWYALAYLVGVLWAWWLLRRIAYAAAIGTLEGPITQHTIESDRRARGPSWVHVGDDDDSDHTRDSSKERGKERGKEKGKEQGKDSVRARRQRAREDRHRTLRRTGRRAKVRSRHKAGREERTRLAMQDKEYANELRAQMKAQMHTKAHEKTQAENESSAERNSAQEKHKHADQKQRNKKSQHKASPTGGVPARLTFVPPAAIDEFVTWAIFGILIGGRLGYVGIYNAPYYSSNPNEILAVWQGGMSFHGGAVGLIVAALLYARLRRLPFLALTDLLALGCTLGLLLGRIANFINGELYGRPSEVAWAFVFPTADQQPRHPSQLYEALAEGLLLFAFLALLVRLGALYRHGLVSAWFLIGYSVLRFLIEYTREPDSQLGLLWGGLSTGQWLSVPMLVLGLLLLCLPTGRIDPLRP